MSAAQIHTIGGLGPPQTKEGGFQLEVHAVSRDGGLERAAAAYR